VAYTSLTMFLSLKQKERDSATSFSKICKNEQNYDFWFIL